jgi:hypothetical protein
MVRCALTAVLDSGDDYLDSDLAVEAIAAAIIATQLPRGAKITSPYAPDFLLEGSRLEVTDDVLALAVPSAGPNRRRLGMARTLEGALDQPGRAVRWLADLPGPHANLSTERLITAQTLHAKLGSRHSAGHCDLSSTDAPASRTCHRQRGFRSGRKSPKRPSYSPVSSVKT